MTIQQPRLINDIAIPWDTSDVFLKRRTFSVDDIRASGLPQAFPYIAFDEGNLARRRRPILPELDLEQPYLRALYSVPLQNPRVTDDTHTLRLIPRRSEVFRQYWSDEINYVIGSIPPAPNQTVAEKQFEGEIQQSRIGSILDSSMGLT